MPIRRIPTNHRSLTGMLASRKNARMVASESSLERDLLVLLEFDPMVERYEEQPVRIEYIDKEGHNHTYIPDVLIYYHTDILPTHQPLLCEVKYRQELFAKWEEVKPKVRAGRAYAHGRGWRFKILTEREIRTPYLQSAKFLRSYHNLTVKDEEVRLIVDTLCRVGESSPEQLLRSLSQDAFKIAELIPTLWYLVSQGSISADLNQPLTMKTRLWITAASQTE